MITLTESAATKVKGLLDREGKAAYGLRLKVVGGGCSGLEYKMGFEPAPQDTDEVIELHGVKVFIDPDSALYLTGMELDYQDSLTSSGFKFKNPNATGTCGCGESFSV